MVTAQFSAGKLAGPDKNPIWFKDYHPHSMQRI
jgi:hypothetical protein